MEQNIIFKKATFGGFEREDVMRYIAEITDDFHKSTVKKDAELKTAKESIASLTAETERLKAEKRELSERCAYLESSLEEIKQGAKETEKDDVDGENIDLKEAVKYMLEKIDELLERDKKSLAQVDDKSDYDQDLFDIIDRYTEE